MKRIVIIGTTGSGKTTLAQKLAARFGLDFTDLDDLNHLPGWQARSPGELRQLADSATAKDAWVLSGNYLKLQDLTWARADTLVWLDYSFLRTLWQLSRRSFRRVRTRELVCNGNVETWKLLFSEKGIIFWFLKTYSKNKRRYGEIFLNRAKHPHLSFVRLKSPQQTENWLKELS